MPEQVNLLRLLTWLSPAFPVGAFAYSHGLERAIHDGLIRDRATLTAWLADLLERGSAWNDAVLLAEAWRGDADDLPDLAAAMAGSRERHMETTLQGGAFAEAVATWSQALSSTPPPSVLPDISPTRGEITASASLSPVSGNPGEASTLPISPLVGEMSGRTEGGNVELCAARAHREEENQLPYPIAVGRTAAGHGIPLAETLTAYLHAFASNLVQASVRLVPLGQRDGLATMAALEPVILATAERAASSGLDDLGSCTILSDIAAMRHETQYSRVFRS